MDIVVNGLWIGDLDTMQILSINSFLKQGHKYRLWIYDKNIENIPKGVEICDANTILHNKYIFRHWTGNLATFSDIFRFKLLYLYGGWWADCDVICLHPLPTVNYFYGGERKKQTGAFKSKAPHALWIGLMKFQKNDELLYKMYNKMLLKIDDFKYNKNIPFSYGQTHLKKLLIKKYGEDFLYTHNNNLNIDLFNPFAHFDKIDFFKKNNQTECCNRWGWEKKIINNILNESYTIHLYNTIIKILEKNKGKFLLIDELNQYLQIVD